MSSWGFLVSISVGWVWIGWVEHRDWGWLSTACGRVSVDSIDILCLGEPFGDSVAWLASPAMFLGLSKLVEVLHGGILIDFLDSSKTGGCEALPINVLPVVGRTGDGFLDCSYRLGCELSVLYGLVPVMDVPITCWGRGSVVWGTVVGGEVGAVRNGNIVPGLAGANWG